MSIFDVKVGYSCNNHCKHCVIDSNKQFLINQNKKIDLSYGEIIETLKSKECRLADSIVITGGEPTIRKEFMRIINFIVTRYPNKKITLQTNGRNLIKFIDELKGLTNNLSYVIALHGTEETHNIVTSNLNGNPFKETLNTIVKLKEIYSDFNQIVRIEIVLSKLNLANISELLKLLYSKDILNIGISYPHMDGMYEHRRQECEQLHFSYEELRKYIYDWQHITAEKEGAKVYFEEVPQCIFIKDGKDYSIPNKFYSLSQNRINASVKYPEKELDTNFLSAFEMSHSYGECCERCRLKASKECIGTWYESVELFGDKGLSPL